MESCQRSLPRTGALILSCPGEAINRWEEFHAALAIICQGARDEVGYDPTDLLRVLAEDGAVTLARQLVTGVDASNSFTYLRERGRLDIAVEALFLTESFAGLFDEDILESARRRLAEAGLK